jgi:hypothetical protein
MTELTIITNNVPRDVIEAYELSKDEQKEFDYYDWDKIEAGEINPSFFRYKDQLYDIDEFMTTRMYGPIDLVVQLLDWDGIQTESFFSGILIKYVDNFERVIVARYYS